jgi:hypothetical protein
MIWLLATRGASTRLRSAPYTETTIEGVHSVVYRPGIEPVPFSGSDSSAGELGTYERGVHRLTGYVFSYHGSAAETLFAITDPIDLIIRYRGGGERRIRTLLDVLFVGDATVTVPGVNTGASELVGVPFRAQIPAVDTLAAHVQDTADV